MGNTGLRVIITGATGMVGEGVMHECLNDPSVEAVLVVNRKPTEVHHPKLKEVLHSNFFDLSPVEDQLSGYDACFFCLGVSSIGMKEEEYYKMTYTLTMHFAETVSRQNKDMAFCYISGAGTDTSEKGRSMWARIKGKTENALTQLPFRQAYAFRPGFIKAIKGMKHTNPLYKYVSWLFPVGRALYSKGFCTLQELASAMIHVAKHGYDTRIIEGDNIIKLGKPNHKNY